jgi:putative two-component system response regulator
MSGEPILCVDDDEQARGLMVRMLSGSGHDIVSVANVEEAREALAARPFSVVLCDIGLPGASGLELVEELARTRPEVATVMVTGRDDPGLADTALELGAYGYLTKPFDANELLIDVSTALQRRNRESERRVHASRLEEMVAARTVELEDAVAKLAASERDLRHAYDETVARLGRAIEYHDGDLGAHDERVGSYVLAIALGLDRDRAELLRLVSPLHDIGKIAIPAAILQKSGPLSAEERRTMERHTAVGHELLAGSGNELLELAATIAWTHQERWDGTGYPRQLAGEEIPLEGRIVAVADVFDALTSDRPYRPRLTAAEARAHVAAGRGKAFDPAVVDAFLCAVRRASSSPSRSRAGSLPTSSGRAPRRGRGREGRSG